MALAILKVDQDVADLADVGAHQLKMAKKDFVGEAVRTYLQLRRTEIESNMRATMALLDGSARREVSLLAGLSPQRVDELGGVDEDE